MWRCLVTCTSLRTLTRSASRARNLPACLTNQVILAYSECDLDNQASKHSSSELVPELRWHLERFAEDGPRGLVFVGPKGRAAAPVELPEDLEQGP
jgi:hypothetical protein